MNDDTIIGANQTGTSFADIIINNDNAVADGLISGFAQFVHDPKYLKDTVSLFNKQAIPNKFADAVVVRRIETNKLNSIWNFPLNLLCPTTIPLPWTFVTATVKSLTSQFNTEFNIMRTIDFIGRNYVQITLPEINLTNISISKRQPAVASSQYVGAWYRDLIPRIIDNVTFYPRSNSHKLFAYSGYDIFVHNILFGNNAKKFTDMMSGEDSFELCYDPYRVHGSALGIASYRGVDNVAEYQTNYMAAGASKKDLKWLQIFGQNTAKYYAQDGFNDELQIDTYMNEEQLKEVYRRNVYYEQPVAQNYNARHSIHSRRVVHAMKVIMFPLDILPFGYSIASSLPSASLAGDCGYIKINLRTDWLDRSFYITPLSEIPKLFPIVNHTHYQPGDVIPGVNVQSATGLAAPDQIDARYQFAFDSVPAQGVAVAAKISLTKTTTSALIGWVNPLSVGYYGNEILWTKKLGLGINTLNNDPDTTNPLPEKIISAPGAVVNGWDPTVLEGVIYTQNTPYVGSGGTFDKSNMLVEGQVLSGISSGPTWGGTKPYAEEAYTTSNTSTSFNTFDDVGSVSSLTRRKTMFNQKLSDIDMNYYNSIKTQITVKLFQVGYQSLPCIREFLSKLPNIYITTEWEDKDNSINDSKIEINNDLYIQAILLWFLPIDSNGVEQTRMYAQHCINHEAPPISIMKMQNQQAQGITYFNWDVLNMMTPHLLGMENPLLENMGLVAFTSKLVSNELPLAYYDSNISGYINASFLANSNTVNTVGSLVNLKRGSIKTLSIGINGVANVNLNLFRLIF